jgi:hypothetical protein
MNPLSKPLSSSFFAALLAAALSANAQDQTAASAESTSGKSAIGYTSVQEALESLKSKPGISVTVTNPDSWVIIVEPQPYTQWSFTPAGHYAYPAVVRREIKQRDGAIAVEMSALCQAEKAACDKLLEEFKQLNERMRQSIQDRLKGNAPK